MKKNNFSSCRGVPFKYKSLHNGVFCFFMFFISFAIFAQKTNYKGHVYDSKGEPLFGVTVVIKGTQKGVTTGVDGEFVISAEIKQTLVFSYVGFENKEIYLRKETNLSVNMVPKQETLNEVVVAYGGKQKKISVVGAVAQVSGKTLTSVKMGSSLESSLQGRLPGLTVIMTDPTPGEEAMGNYYAASPIKMSIRGNSSMRSNTPLFIVDGVERPFSNLNPNDVESVSILKDASATAVYGVKGASGVIIVTTKRGRSGSIELNFNSSFSMKEAAILPKYMNAYETMKLRNEAWSNDGLWNNIVSDEVLNHYKNQDLPYLYPNFDWMSYYFKPAFDQTYDLSARGGNDFVKYYSSIGYLNEGDIWAIGNDFPYSYDNQNAHYGSTRYNFVNNLDFMLSKNTKFTINLGGNVKSWGKPIDTFTQEAWFESATALPYYPAEAVAQYPDNLIPYNQNSNRPYIKPAAGEVRRNWLGGQGFSRFKSNQFNVDMKFDQKLDIITKGLTGSFLYSYNTDVIYKKDYNLPQYFGYYLDPNTQQWNRYDNGGGEDLDTPQPVLQVNNNEDVFQGSKSHYYEFRMGYNRNFGKHNVDAMGIFSRRQAIYSLAEFPHYEENWVGRIGYNYDDRYFVEANAAYTGSEKFAPGLRFGLFPSVGGSWVVSNEKFFGSNLKKTINLMKFRYSYGIVGSDAGIDRWLYKSTYSESGGTSFGDPSQFYPYITEGPLPVLDATWEKAYKQNLGLEISFFDNLITLTADIFNERREDLLQPRQQVPAWVGVPSVTANIGSSKSHGFELVLGLNKYFENGYFLTFLGNITGQENRMVYYDESENVPFNLKVEGKPVDIARRLGSYTPATGLVDQGFYQNFDELFLYPRAGGQSPIVGDLKFLDFNGDGSVNDQDRVVAKYPSIPTYTWNTTFGGGYKNFSCDFTFYGISDVQVPVRQGGMFFLYPFSQNKDNAYTAHENHWTPTNTNPEFPAVHTEATKQYNYQISNYAMIMGKYIRLRNVGLHYDIKSPTLLKTLRISNFQVGLLGTNLWTWKKTNWGGDPEGANYGVDFGAYPQMKRYSLDLRLKF